MLTEEQIKELETTHKRIAVVSGKIVEPAKEPPWQCVFRKPSRAEYKRFRSMAHNEATKADAQENLARATVVYPSKDAFDFLLDEWPAIPEAAAGQISELAGFAVDESGKS